MKVFIGRRRSGKTTKALLYMVKNPKVNLVVYSINERTNVLELIKSLKIDIQPERIVVYNKWLSIGNDRKFIFDNVDLWIDEIVRDHPARFGDVLSAVLPMRVEGYIINKEED